MSPSWNRKKSFCVRTSTVSIYSVLRNLCHSSQASKQVIRILLYLLQQTMSSSSSRDPASNQLLEHQQRQQRQQRQQQQQQQQHQPKKEGDDKRHVVTSNGAPVDSLTASLTAGPSGPIVLQDFTLIDHLARFDRERIPERVVHAKGAGARGYFQVCDNPALIQSICKASVFAHAGKTTPVAVRFSTVGGESGSADTARDPRGFAIKFFTDEGNWDLVGNNTPIFFLRDPMLFPRYVTRNCMMDRIDG